MEKGLLCKSGYLFNRKTEKLEWCEFISAIFTLDDNSPIVYKCILGGNEVELVDDKYGLKVYESEELFKRGCCMSPLKIYEYTIKKVLPFNDAMKVWMFKDGEACEIDARTVSLVYSVKGELTTGGDVKFYKDRESVYNYHDYVVKGADGVERLVECPYSKMKLSEEQNNIVCILKDAIKEARELGLCLVYDESYGKLLVYNRKNTDEYSIACDYDRNEDDGYVDVTDMGIDIAGVESMYEDNSFAVKFKDEK